MLLLCRRVPIRNTVAAGETQKKVKYCLELRGPWADPQHPREWMEVSALAPRGLLHTPGMVGWWWCLSTFLPFACVALPWTYPHFHLSPSSCPYPHQKASRLWHHWHTDSQLWPCLSWQTQDVDSATSASSTPYLEQTLPISHIFTAMWELVKERFGRTRNWS